MKVRKQLDHLLHEGKVIALACDCMLMDVKTYFTVLVIHIDELTRPSSRTESRPPDIIIPMKADGK